MWHMQFDNIFTINLHFFVFEVFLGFEPFDAFVVLSQWSWDLELTSWFLSDWKTTFQIRSNIKLGEFKDSDRKRFWYCYSKTLFQGSCIFWSHPNPRSNKILGKLGANLFPTKFSRAIASAWSIALWVYLYYYYVIEFHLDLIWGQYLHCCLVGPLCYATES